MTSTLEHNSCFPLVCFGFTTFTIVLLLKRNFIVILLFIVIVAHENSVCGSIGT